MSVEATTTSTCSAASAPSSSSVVIRNTITPPTTKNAIPSSTSRFERERTTPPRLARARERRGQVGTHPGFSGGGAYFRSPNAAVGRATPDVPGGVGRLSGFADFHNTPQMCHLRLVSGD